MPTNLDALKNICFTLVLLLSLFAIQASAQHSFPEKALGTWEGRMQLFKEGAVYDSVDVVMNITQTPDPGIYGWKTEYLSEKYPITKNYKLRLLDAEKQIYAIDEGDGIVLKAYVYADKLYSNFATHGSFLTSFYELKDDQLIFEVSSGKELDVTQGVTNYAVSNMQRVVMRRAKKSISTNDDHK